jgi:MFS family permease
MIVNGATFGLSAAVIAVVPFAAAARDEGVRPRILQEAREGLTATWSMPGVRTVLWASTAVIVFAATVNVGELLLARDLGASASQFAILMAAVGVGVVIGSLAGARGGPLSDLKARYIAGIFLIGLSVLALAAVDSFVAALIAFLVTGLGNGIVVVHERLIFHAAVPDRLMGRAFALLDTLGGWGFAAAFVGAGGIIAALGTRAVFAIAGGAGLLVAVAVALALRGVWQRERRPAGAAAGD